MSLIISNSEVPYYVIANHILPMTELSSKLFLVTKSKNHVMMGCFLFKTIKPPLNLKIAGLVIYHWSMLACSCQKMQSHRKSCFFSTQIFKFALSNFVRIMFALTHTHVSYNLSECSLCIHFVKTWPNFIYSNQRSGEPFI